MIRTLKTVAVAMLPARVTELVRREVCVRRVLQNIHAEGDLTLLPAVVRPDHTSWDIGAHTGMYIPALSRLSKSVRAFEPIPANRRILETVVRRAALANVTISALAIADVGGDAHMHIPREGAFGGYAMASLDDRGAVAVSTATVDGLVAQGWAPPNFIKCDVEGAELRVIAGAADVIARYRPTWLMETFDDAVIDRMRVLGYRTYTYDWKANRVIAVTRRLGWTRNYWFWPSESEPPAGWLPL